MAKVTVQTTQLLRLAHAGLKHSGQREQDAAESLLSLIVLKLKHEQIVVDGAMYSRYKFLRDSTTK